MKTNEDRKLLLFYFLIERAGGDFVFYLRLWPTTLSCLIVKVVIICESGGFSTHF